MGTPQRIVERSLHIQDDVLQHAAAAKLALELGEYEQVAASIDAAIAASRRSIEELLKAEPLLGELPRGHEAD